MMVIPETGRVH